MRTTLTLDPDVARALHDAVHRERRPMKQVVNDALRRGLSRATAPREPYHVKVHDARLRPGFDMAGLNRLADELDDERILTNLTRNS